MRAVPAGGSGPRAHLQRAAHLLRPQLPGAHAAELLVQQPARHVPGVQRARDARSRSIRELVIPDPALSIRGGAIAPWATAMARGEGWTFRIADAVAKACEVNLDTPWKQARQEEAGAGALRARRAKDRGHLGQGGHARATAPGA